MEEFQLCIFPIVGRLQYSFWLFSFFHFPNFPPHCISYNLCLSHLPLPRHLFFQSHHLFFPTSSSVMSLLSPPHVPLLSPSLLFVFTTFPSFPSSSSPLSPHLPFQYLSHSSFSPSLPQTHQCLSRLVYPLVNVIFMSTVPLKYLQ